MLVATANRDMVCPKTQAKKNIIKPSFLKNKIRHPRVPPIFRIILIKNIIEIKNSKINRYPIIFEAPPKASFNAFDVSGKRIVYNVTW